MESSFRFGIIERLTVAGFVAGVFGVVASVSLPGPYQEYLAHSGWGPVLFWVSVAVILSSVLLFICDLALYIAIKRGIKLGMALVFVGFGLIALGAVVGALGAIKMDSAKEAALHPPEGPLKVHGISFPLDYVDGVKTEGITWQKGYARTELMLYNSLGDAITDVDAIFQPEFPIIKSSAISSFAKCQIGPVAMPPSPIVMGTVEDGTTKVFGSDGPEDMNISIVPSHRLYCDKLAGNTNIRVVLATVVMTANPTMGPMFESERKDPHFIVVKLRYVVGSERHEELFQLNFQVGH